MSTCGALTHDFLNSFPQDLGLLGISKVLLCFDNDEAGQVMATNMSTHLHNISIPFEIEKPLKKDWNEDLQGAL